MSWFTELAGKAESLLEKVDNVAATALTKEQADIQNVGLNSSGTTPLPSVTPASTQRTSSVPPSGQQGNITRSASDTSVLGLYIQWFTVHVIDNRHGWSSCTYGLFIWRQNDFHSRVSFIPEWGLYCIHLIKWNGSAWGVLAHTRSDMGVQHVPDHMICNQSGTKFVFSLHCTRMKFCTRTNFNSGWKLEWTHSRITYTGMKCQFDIM